MKGRLTCDDLYLKRMNLRREALRRQVPYGTHVKSRIDAESITRDLIRVSR